MRVWLMVVLILLMSGCSVFTRSMTSSQRSELRNVRSHVAAHRDAIENAAREAGTAGVLWVPGQDAWLPGDGPEDAIGRRLASKDGPDFRKSLATRPNTYVVFIYASPIPREPVVLSTAEVIAGADWVGLAEKIRLVEESLDHARSVVIDGIRLSMLTREEAKAHAVALETITKELSTLAQDIKSLSEADAASTLTVEQRLVELKTAIDAILTKVNTL